MIAIHFQDGNNFSSIWKNYCEVNGLEFKIVSCYESDIIRQLTGCRYLLWHVDNFSYKDHLFAKQLIKSVELMGIKVFPNYDTVWHFDDKVAQKYLLESIGAPIVPTTILYDKSEALRWTRKVVYPKVFKLRSGSGSKNVYLVRDRNAAERLVKIAFGKGFSVINMRYLLKERFRKYKIGKESRLGVLKGIARLFLGTTYLKMSPKEIGYLYMQDFIPGNRFDQRVIVIGEYAFAIKRMVRENDFRASGSGQIDYNKETIDLNCVKLAFETSEKLGTQCLSYDFIYDENMQPLIVEISFGFNKMGYYSCEGYWDKELNWHAGSIRPEEWMIANLLKHR